MKYFLVSVFCKADGQFLFQAVKVATENSLPTAQEVDKSLRAITPRNYESIHITAFSEFPDLDTYKNFQTKIL